LPSFTFATTPTTPTNIYIRAIDADSVTSLRGVASIEAGVSVVSGRLKVSNAYGSEQLPLPVNATVQYWNGTGWITSTTDNATTFNTATNLVVVPVKGPLVAGNVSVANAGTVTVAGGMRAFSINRPGVSGSADISLSSPAYLLSVAGRVTFGVYKGANQFIYQREAY
jgi:MSHA biogenesis protein MshQ